MGVRDLSVLGVPLTLADGRVGIRAVAHAALTGGKLYSIIPSRDTTTDITTAAAKNDGSAVTQAPATLAVPHYNAVASRDYAISEVALLIVGGPIKAYVINTAGAITGGTSYLKAVNASSNLQVDGAARTTSSVAFACEDQDSATASLINIQMLGIPAII